MSVSSLIRAKAARLSNRYYRKQSEQKKGGNMAYMVGTKFLIKSYELIDSGAVNIFSDEFEIVVENLHILFRLRKDKKKEEGEFSITRGEGSALFFDIYNCANPFTQGCFEPIRIGHIDESPLYISFTVHTTSEKLKARVFTYNLYMDEKK
jgi:hypothetical protein